MQVFHVLVCFCCISCLFPFQNLVCLSCCEKVRPVLKWKVFCWSKFAPWDSWHVCTWLEMKSFRMCLNKWIDAAFRIKLLTKMSFLNHVSMMITEYILWRQQIFSFGGETPLWKGVKFFYKHYQPPKKENIPIGQDCMFSLNFHLVVC